MKNNQLIFSKYKNQLLKKGYVVIRNFFNEEESEELKKIIYNVHNKFTKEHSQPQSSPSDVAGMHKYREYWDLICNEKILDTLNGIIGEDVYYLYNSNTRVNSISQQYNWHRDSACRLFGFGPDWDKDEIYKVVRVGIYLFDSKNINSGLNVIPNSHRTKYNLDNVLRIIQYKLKNIENKYAQFLRSTLSKFIGHDVKTNKGDIIIFLANLMHSDIPTNKSGRVTAFMAYGPNNKHSKNHVNYYMMHRKNHKMNNEENARQFYNLLRSKNIFFPLPEKKDDIKGFSV